ncbi:hypothetical protein F5878DRAFT_666946 [Lentinula raphanica]|uniref:Uncharacterized protein n=1 Tax=Lentinula raphanica TaxID=153919 RepID=A0AA38NWP9_9AGAR|nr:hypothetical protein F5878DRAFT_666946 [Lentinula raphanica]
MNGMENTGEPELKKRTRNQAARDRKKSRRQQWLTDKKAVEDDRQKLFLELQTAIQTEVQQQVDSSVKHFEDESKRQEQLIRDLRDEILLLQGEIDSSLWDKLQQFLENYIGVPVHIYPTEIGAHSHYIETLKELEQRRKHPLRSDDPDFPTAQTTFIHENGLHLGIEQKILDVLWEVQITPWDAFTADERNRIQAALKIMMDYTRTTPAITLNSVRTFCYLFT